MDYVMHVKVNQNNTSYLARHRLSETQVWTTHCSYYRT